MSTKERAVADLRAVIAEKHGLTPVQAKEMQGDTREELEDSAQFIASLGPGKAPGNAAQPGRSRIVQEFIAERDKAAAKDVPLTKRIGWSSK